MKCTIIIYHKMKILGHIRVQGSSWSVFTLSPFAHAFLQVWQQKLAVEGIDGGDIGEDVLHHFQRERAFSCLLHQRVIKHLHNRAKEEFISFIIVFCMLRCLNSISFQADIG